MIYLTFTYIKDVDNGYIPIGIFLDLSKAFDTLNHAILFDKLILYGINNNALSLCQSYLTNRKQYVHFEEVDSNFADLDTGVPQGSILGPLFFLIYINDISNSNELLTPISYADDTTLYTTLNEIKRTSKDISPEEALTKNLNDVNEWLVANKLTPNVSKTKYMICTHSNKRIIPKLNIVLNNEQ